MPTVNRYLDAAVLKPETTQQDMIAAVRTCVSLATYSVCVRPCDIVKARELCAGSATKVCVVLAFPHGLHLSASKADEARRYVDLGVDEIDMVANYGLARSGDWAAVLADIQAVTAVTLSAGVPLKVIIETSQLTAAEIKKMVDICIEAGADFVKTSTGFTGEGAREDDVRLMLETAAGRIKVKASGGIRDRERADMFIAMGVDRLGVGWTSCHAICAGGPDAMRAGY
ncbi:MAG: deoxyribose-phosphate aldolase [Lentisphaeria bacterium]|nr:deoxyribose-phosphate aldolase [Lentisphaeria bacterium]